MIFDLKKAKEIGRNYILYVEEGEMIEEGTWVKGNFEIWLDRLIVSQGDKYWKWC